MERNQEIPKRLSISYPGIPASINLPTPKTIQLKNVKIECIPKALHFGNAPHWDANTQALYFVDVYNSEIHRYLPRNGDHTCAVVRHPNGQQKDVTFIIPIKNKLNEFVIGFGGDIVKVTWNGEDSKVSSFERIMVLEETYPKVKLHGAKASPDGVLFVGSMLEGKFASANRYELGNLFAISGTRAKLLLLYVGKLTGFTWDTSGASFYHVDALEGTVESYFYDKKNLSCKVLRRVFDFTGLGQTNPPYRTPYGITIDKRSNLWIAMNGLGKVVMIDPREPDTAYEIPLPCLEVTSVAFGGANLDELYVTTAYSSVSEEFRSYLHGTGCLFKITGLEYPGIAGVPVSFD